MRSRTPTAMVMNEGETPNGESVEIPSENHIRAMSAMVGRQP